MESRMYLALCREFIVVCARAGGANTTSFLAVHFAKRNTKNCGGEKRSGESEGGQKILPPHTPSFSPPRAIGFQNSKSGFSSKKVRILTKRHRQLGNEVIGSPPPPGPPPRPRPGVLFFVFFL